MGLTKTIEIDGKQVPFKASAAIPRIYRIKFHRDVYKDLAALEKAVGKNALYDFEALGGFHYSEYPAFYN